MNDLLVNILGIANGNRQSSPNVDRHDHNNGHDHDKKWDKDRGHKSHGKHHDD